MVLDKVPGTSGTPNANENPWGPAGWPGVASSAPPPPPGAPCDGGAGSIRSVPLCLFLAECLQGFRSVADTRTHGPTCTTPRVPRLVARRVPVTGRPAAPTAEGPASLRRPSVGVRVGILFFCLVGRVLFCGVPFFEEFGHVVKDQVEINGKHDGGKEAEHPSCFGSRV